MSLAWLGGIVLAVSVAACTAVAHPTPIPQIVVTETVEGERPFTQPTFSPLTSTLFTTPTANNSPLIIPIPTNTLTTTSTSSAWREGAIFLKFEQFMGYGYIKLLPFSVETGAIPITNPPLGSLEWQILAFSNHSDQVAYWILNPTGQIWISDVWLQSPQLIAEGPAWTPNVSDLSQFWNVGETHFLNVYWSSNDRYLFIEKEDKHSWIYDVINQTLLDWPYQCDRVAVSPQSTRLATWCISTTESKTAVIEWDGSIWYSDNLPEFTLINRDGTYIPPNWAWSPNGEWFVYAKELHHKDGFWALTLTDSHGNYPITLNTNATFYTFSGSISVNWSPNSDRLVFHGIGSKNRPCPVRLDPLTEEPVYNTRCWQVLDIASKDIAWSELQAFPTLFPYGADRMIWESYSVIRQAVFSPDGNALALHVANGGPQDFAIVDLITGEVETLLDFRAMEIYWARGQP
jgi:hypothetical protein